MQGPERPEKSLGSVVSIDIKDPNLEAAKRRAVEVLGKANQDPVKVIEELEQEVRAMEIAPRFSKERIVSHSSSHGIPRDAVINPSLQNLTESEYKRIQLLLSLEAVRRAVSNSVLPLEQIVMDIEASKQLS